MNTPPLAGALELAAPPPVTVGLGTKLGIVTAAAAGLIGVITAILNGDHTEETITALLVAGANVYGVVTGRMNQAAAGLAAVAHVAGAARPIVDTAQDAATSAAKRGTGERRP